MYNFKKIQVVPTQKDFLDIVLSRTQRKTPTVVHPQYKITRIRKFYMRKVKYTQATFHEKLSQILDDFPRLDDIHPFYADLINVLYDKDHYKLALGQINIARNLIDTVGKDYVRLLKYGDSLYRCKQLKRAGMGRMCTITKKLGPSMAYLEHVRQHLSRLPSIDPSTRTLILCGFPNVGKSSFMNKITRADVEVHNYPFTTKSIFCGHTDYRYLRWQVLDTPGILDHPLEDRNVIEMQAITALAHLRAAVLYFLDISETCGYSIEQQVSLFHNISPLFTGKPLVVVFSKLDLKRVDQLTAQQQALLDSLGSSVVKVAASTHTDEGVSTVKQVACDMLLEQRVEAKLRGSKGSDVLQRVHVAVPVPRDNQERPSYVPESVLQQKNQPADMQPPKRITMKQREDMAGGPTEFYFDLREHYDLKVDDWKQDIQPEFIDGHNIADWVDPDVLHKLDELDREEDERIAKLAEQTAEDDGDDSSSLSEDTKAIAERIKHAKHMARDAHRSKLGLNHHIISRTTRISRMTEGAKLVQDLVEKTGVSVEAAQTALEHARTRGRSRSRSIARTSRESDSDTEMMDANQPRGRSTSRTESSVGRSLSVTARGKRARSGSRPPGDVATPEEKLARFKAEKKLRKAQRNMQKTAHVTESDRFVGTAKPRHLYSGKRGIGKTDRR